MSIILSELQSSGILTLTLNRPEQLNALSFAVLTALDNEFQQAQKNPEVKALLITGIGKAFCAGADIHELAALNGQTGLSFARFGQSVFRRLEALTKPSLAAINGYAFGGGCELAMSASVRIASEKAQFGQPEVKLGVIPGYGGTQRLARLIGKGRAIDLCITGRFINASDALNWGLVSEVVAPDQVIKRAEAILLGILSQGPLAIASCLSAIHSGFDLTLDEALEFEAVHFGLTCASADKREGVAAFLEKRTAEFKGE